MHLLLFLIKVPGVDPLQVESSLHLDLSCFVRNKALHLPIGSEDCMFPSQH